jgi:hypothetical protein
MSVDGAVQSTECGIGALRQLIDLWLEL